MFRFRCQFSIDEKTIVAAFWANCTQKKRRRFVTLVTQAGVSIKQCSENVKATLIKI